MSSPWKTSRREEALWALPVIVELAKDVLTPEKYNEAETISRMLIRSGERRRYAQMKLVVLTLKKPWRPLFYLKPLIEGLPRNTRDVIRYLGDYVDLITKEMTYEFFDGKARRRSLGQNLRVLMNNRFQPADLVENLCRFNSFLYSPSKHDFSLPFGRQHRFTSREAVLTAYIAMELGERIKSLSKLVRIAIERDDLYSIGGRWGSKERVSYHGP